LKLSFIAFAFHLSNFRAFNGKDLESAFASAKTITTSSIKHNSFHIIVTVTADTIIITIITSR